ncbi:hypothetical protein N8940_01165 [Sphingomonadaceae bacterium]|nr:hypothetical protein [Sphingomonadaceae bacterium]
MNALPAIFSQQRIAASAALAALTLLLSGCFLSPGKFDAQLEIREDRSFTYSYVGEIHLLPLGKAADDDAFTAEDCYDDDYQDRPCTAAELAEQKADWDAGAEERLEMKKQQATMAATMLGGIDPSDPESGEKFAASLRRQKGWDRVEYAGDGLFNVSFSISGSLETDFVHPTIEGFPMANFFVLVANRKDGRVRIEAPGFAPSGGNSPMGAMMGSMTGMAGMAATGGNAGASDNSPAPPEINGTFRIITDAPILANNTDEGPSGTAEGNLLLWNVDATTTSAPTALLQL